jgi:hypothetical protein
LPFLGAQQKINKLPFVMVWPFFQRLALNSTCSGNAYGFDLVATIIFFFSHISIDCWRLAKSHEILKNFASFAYQTGKN